MKKNILENAGHGSLGHRIFCILRDKILNKLLTEGILSRHKGDDGYIYTPNRKESSRVKQLLDELTLSEDPLWEYVTSL